MQGTEIRGLEGLEEIDTFTKDILYERVEDGDCSDRTKVGWRQTKRQGIVFGCEIMAERFACGQG
jgi:hypothetical protein